MTLAAAVVLPLEAWVNITEIDVFDAGNSKTNSLYWIATRPQTGNWRLADGYRAPLVMAFVDGIGNSGNNGRVDFFVRSVARR